jgi:hypothetical protein
MNFYISTHQYQLITMDLGLAGFHVEMENLGVWLLILLLAVAVAAQSKLAQQERKSA